jgi:exopolyphosphatase / guanosine-5'-triphosphate,3'-diphosphate pyrophosphatase
MNKVAVIDLGTNTFNLLVVHRQGEGLRMVYSTKEGVALGMGGINSNRIAEDAWQRGVECVARFQKKAMELGAKQLLAIATSAIRNASNGAEFVAELEEMGVPVKVISGIKEAAYIYQGVAIGHDFENPGLIMDIGGGSTEFILADQHGVNKLNSFEIGVSRIYQQLAFKDPFSQDDVRKIKDYLNAKTGDFFDGMSGIDLIGSSGSFETLYEMLHDQPFPSDYQSITLTRDEMEEIIRTILKMTEAERDRHQRIIAVRRKMLPIAAVKIQWVLEKIKAERVIITPYSLKEGVAYELFTTH